MNCNEFTSADQQQQNEENLLQQSKLEPLGKEYGDCSSSEFDGQTQLHSSNCTSSTLSSVTLPLDKNNITPAYSGSQNVCKSTNEVHFDESCEHPEDVPLRESLNVEMQGLQKQQSQISSKSHATSFRLNHRTSFFSGHNLISEEEGADQNGVLTRVTTDQTDSLPDHMRFTYLEAMALLFSIGSFLTDIVTDVTVATLHYLNSNYWYFALTVTFVALPTLVMTSISLRWYIVDSRQESSPKVSKTQWFLRVLFLLLQLGPILRYIDSFMYGIQFRKHQYEMRDRKAARRYFQYMIYEDADATMLRMFECFMEAAPQLVLQIYILAVSKPHGEDDWTVIVQVISVVSSLVSLSWSLVSYLRILRMSLPSKKNMSWPGAIVQFHWRFCLIGSRVLTLALFASEYSYYISIVCALHWLVMFGWIVSMKTNFCDNKLEELFYNAILAVTFIFCYFNPVDSPTRVRYTLYYGFNLLENSILIYLWFHACHPSKWYRMPGLIGFFVSFLAGIIFMMIYYLKLHPTKNIRLCHRTGANDVQQQQQQQQSVEEVNHSQFSPVHSIYGNINNSQREHSLPPRWPTNGSVRAAKRQYSDVWTTQGRLLHPRPNVPITIRSTGSNSHAKL